MNYYQHHLGDYSKDTAHLSMIEDGAYRRLLDLYYSTEHPLPLEMGKLYRLVRVLTKADKQAVETVLAEFFTQSPDGWRHKRCDQEIARAQEKSNKARASVESRWRNERNTNVSTNVLPTQYEGNTPNSHKPITNSQSSQQPPVDNSTRAGAVAAKLRAAGVKVTGQNPLLQAWCEELRATDQQLDEAVERARLHKPLPAEIAAAYLDPIIKEICNPPPAKQKVNGNGSGAAWWTSNAGIDRKAREIGMQARGGEDYDSFKARIFEKLLGVQP